jgi:hypothetical protein
MSLDTSNHGGLKSFEPIHLLNPMGFKYKSWDNRIYPPFYNPEKIKWLQNNWHTDENDIFICTHQKVGTHLTKKFLCEILRNTIDYPVNNGISSGDIGHNTIPWPEVMVSQHGEDHFLAFLEATKGLPRVWYTHCSIHDLPFCTAHPNSKFIHVFRDPKGVFVSQYHFYRSHPMLGVSDKMTYDDFLAFFLEGNLYFGDYHVHTLDWINTLDKRIKKDKLLVIRYEDLVERKLDSVKTLTNFILNAHSLTENQFEEIIRTTEFNKMKQEMMVNPQSFHFNPQTFFRSGTCYDWMEKLNSDQIDQIDTKSKSIWGKNNTSAPDLQNVQTVK